MPNSTDRFARAIAAFDAYHQKDPNLQTFNGQVFPKELLYAQRMTARLSQYAPEAVEEVKLAARSQHIGRWEIPREKYPGDKKGYLQWRNEEKLHHAKIAENILSKCGYETKIIDQVKFLLLKKELYTNRHTQLLEDVICLVFVEYYLEEFATKHEDEKVIDILRKTTKKMTPKAIDAVGQLPLPSRIKGLIAQAAIPV
jgi:hypothetical protein